jgi:hypothetical protein
MITAKACRQGRPFNSHRPIRQSPETRMLRRIKQPLIGSNQHEYKSYKPALRFLRIYLLDRHSHSKLLADMSRSTSPFRFLDLPKEIRLMVYERIDISMTPFQCIDRSDSSVVQPSLMMRTHTLPVQILATCRLIHSEACSVLAQKLADLRSRIPRIVALAEILDTATYRALVHLIGAALTELHHLLEAQRRNPSKSQPRDPSYIQDRSDDFKKWAVQTSIQLAFQAENNPPPAVDFCAEPAVRYVRIEIDVPKYALVTMPKYVQSPTQTRSPRKTNSSTRVAELLGTSLSLARKGGLDCFTSAMKFCGPEDEEGVECERMWYALDYGVKMEDMRE